MTQPDPLSPNSGPNKNAEALASMLAACDNRLIADPHGPQAQPIGDDDESPGPGAAQFMAAVPALGFIEILGPDSASFLQGQLTNDIDKLAAGDCQWSGLCSPKGRLLATFLIVRPADQPDAYWLLVSRELAPTISKRLGMYVLRAKVKVTDRSDDRLAVGLQGKDAVTALQQSGKTLPQPMTSTQADSGKLLLIGLPPIQSGATTNPRYLAVISAPELPTVWAQMSASVPVRPSSWWRAGDIVNGIAQIVPAIQEAFVPQMVNFELIGGVDFDKGCYTGQEVVARSQYLGKLKRRMFLATADIAPAPGTEVTDANAKPIGTVVASAPSIAVSADNNAVVLFESRVDVDGEAMAGNAVLSRYPLPYDIPEPTPFVRPV